VLRVLYLWLAGIVIFYGGWLFVASFEARVALPPIWGGQYRAWFPGDLFLLVLLAVAVVYCTEHVSVSGWTTLLGLVLGLIVGLAMFRYQITPRELADQWLMFSPTRILAPGGDLHHRCVRVRAIRPPGGLVDSQEWHRPVGRLAGRRGHRRCSSATLCMPGLRRDAPDRGVGHAAPDPRPSRRAVPVRLHHDSRSRRSTTSPAGCRGDETRKAAQVPADHR
jgi:hypothetical protein